MYNSFKPYSDSLPILSTVSAVFAKSSVVWSSLFYIVTNKNIKTKVVEILLGKTVNRKLLKKFSLAVISNDNGKTRYENTRQLSLYTEAFSAKRYNKKNLHRTSHATTTTTVDRKSIQINKIKLRK